MEQTKTLGIHEPTDSKPIPPPVAVPPQDWREKLDAAAKEYAKDFTPHDCEKDFINVQENAIVDYKEGAYWGRKQTLHEIDMELAALEDVLHGEEGEAVTTQRVKIQQHFKTPQ